MAALAEWRDVKNQVRGAGWLGVRLWLFAAALIALAAWIYSIRPEIGLFFKWLFSGR
ncbi:MAG: hypothetical protein JJ902_23065 [Roseibium sp.]|nr:hypothetical protein [Roseibium sp.]